MRDDYLTDAQLAAIGHIAVEAARLEYFIEASIWHALGQAPKIGRDLTQGKGVTQHAKQLKRLLLVQPQADKNRIKAIFDAIRDAIRKRNTFIHGVIFIHSADTFDEIESVDDIIEFDKLTTERVRNRRDPDEHKGLALSTAGDVADALARARADLAGYLTRK